MTEEIKASSIYNNLVFFMYSPIYSNSGFTSFEVVHIPHTAPVWLLMSHVKFPILLQTGICTKTNGNLLTSLRGKSEQGGDLALIFFHLESEEKEESHHETEKSHGLGQSETQNGIREQLLLEGRVAGIADDQRSEDASNTGTRSSYSDCGSSSTNELGSRVNVSGNG